jgi:hypothetical protein
MVSAQTICYSFSAMAEFFATLVLLGLALLWMVAWRRRRHFAVGALIGAVVALVANSWLRSFSLETIPVWLPALPFAFVATTLFVFGALAWFWGED